MILKSKTIQGVPINMGIQWRIEYRLWYELALLIPNFKSQKIIMSARVYFMKTVNDCKDVILMLRMMNCEDGQVYSVSILYFLGNVDPLYCTSVLLPIRYTAHPTYCNIWPTTAVGRMGKSSCPSDLFSSNCHMP